MITFLLSLCIGLGIPSRDPRVPKTYIENIQPRLEPNIGGSIRDKKSIQQRHSRKVLAK